MSDQKQISERFQAILTELLQVQLGKSLRAMDESLTRWRAGDMGVFEAHAEVLKHAARAERMATRVATADGQEAEAILRHAFDAGLVSRDEFVDMTGEEPDAIEPAEGLDDGLSTPLKREVMAELLAQGPVLVHMDARVSDVSVPRHLAEDYKLVLRFGYDLTPAITDLHVDESGISGTLTFGGVPHHCILPWPSVYAVVSEIDRRGMVWPEDVPKLVLEEMADKKDDGVEVKDKRPVEARVLSMEDGRMNKPPGRHLKLVD